MGETVGVMPQADAPASSSTPAAPEKPKGAAGIWIGILLILAGIILGIVLVVSGAKSLISGFDDLQRVPIQGGGVVRIEEPGTQTIYAERPAAQGGSSFSTNTFSGYGPDVDVRVIGPDGGELTVDTSGVTETYTYDGRDGVSIGEFDAPTAGEYQIVTTTEDLGFGQYNTLAVGTGLELSGIGAILGGIFGGGLVVLIGIIVTIIFAVRRSRSKKRIAQASAPYPGSYGGPGAGWPAAPGYAPTGYAPAGYAPPPSPAPGAWPPADTNPGWVPPPVAPPDAGGPGPTWSPPPAPAPQSPPSQTWQPPAPDARPAWQPPAPEPRPAWQPSGDAQPPADPLAPSWDAPAPSDAPPPPPPAPPEDDGNPSS
ncbi:hypothetical protein ACE2AJ_19745 [Aquihabitans daechungensis]|uniref:hypothetical protein n=1 Tax=Aquihabitans daechungensis TaxID=1052257 RepID=UPI003B9F13EE